MSEEKRYATEEEFNAEVERISAEKLAELEAETKAAIEAIHAEAEKEREAQASEWQAKIDALKAEREEMAAEIAAYEQAQLDDRFREALRKKGVSAERTEKLLPFCKIIHAKRFDFDDLKNDYYIEQAAFRTVMDLGKKDAPTTQYLY